MKNKNTLTEGLSNLVDKTKSVLKSGEDTQPVTSSKSNLSKKRKDKVLKTIAKEEQLTKNNTLVRKSEVKNPNPKNTNTRVEDEDIKLIQARKLQIMTKANKNQLSSSPLQMHLVQSESLKMAQEKISDLEEEIMSLRQKNEALSSAAEVLKENNESSKIKIEELKSDLSDEKARLKEEKEVLLSAIEEARNQILRLRNKNEELDKRISNNFHGIRQRENSLEGKIEILKMENSVLQKEKDKKILDLKKDILKLKSNLDSFHKKNHELNILNGKLKSSSHRAVSALRATIYNLEGAKLNQDTQLSQSQKTEKAS